MTSRPYTFTSDWFSNNIPLWTSLFRGWTRRPVKWLEIGSYEGRSAIWALENILKHKDSCITCIDKWDDDKIYTTFKNNIKSNPSFKGKVTSIRAMSRDALTSTKLLKQRGEFDVIYIDADHHSASVLEDAVLAFPLLKPGGMMIFDDYTYSKERDNRCPKQAIDAFINAYAEQVHVVTARWQVVIQKRKHPRTRAPCKSEFFE